MKFLLYVIRPTEDAEGRYGIMETDLSKLGTTETRPVAEDAAYEETLHFVVAFETWFQADWIRKYLSNNVEPDDFLDKERPFSAVLTTK